VDETGLGPNLKAGLGYTVIELVLTDQINCAAGGKKSWRERTGIERGNEGKVPPRITDHSAQESEDAAKGESGSSHSSFRVQLDSSRGRSGSFTA
jgi:hypothetical protein